MTDHPKRRLSRSPLTMIHVTPPDLVHHAARAGFDSVGIPRLPRRRGHRPAHARRQHPGDAQNPTTTQRQRPARLDVEVLRIRPDKNPSEALYILDAVRALAEAQPADSRRRPTARTGCDRRRSFVSAAARMTVRALVIATLRIAVSIRRVPRSTAAHRAFCSGVDGPRPNVPTLVSRRPRFGDAHRSGRFEHPL